MISCQRTDARDICSSCLDMKLLNWVRFTWDLSKLPPIVSELPGHYQIALATKEDENELRKVFSSAFVQSVDEIINVGDLANFKPVLQREVTQHRKLYHSFNQTLKSVQSL